MSPRANLNTKFNRETMHSSSINMLLSALVFCFIRSWQLLFTAFCNFTLALTLRVTEKTSVVDPESVLVYGR